MLLEIDDNKTVGELQERFNDCFPYLKLEFYAKAHSWHGRSLPGSKLEAGEKIGDINKKHEHGILTILSTQKAGDIEKVFKKQFGLFVQVCYLANDKWTETTDTDGLTLQQLCVLAEGEDLKY